MSLYHQLWDPPSRENLQRGASCLRKAQALKAPTAREQEYIGALKVFYTDTDKLDHEKRARAYSDSMRKVYEHNPEDHEAAVVYALSLLGSIPENDAEHTNAKAAVAILANFLTEQPTHPGIAHYIIHSCDNPSMAALASPPRASTPASLRLPRTPFTCLRTFLPASALWQDDIQSNVTAIQIANQMADMQSSRAAPQNALAWIFWRLRLSCRSATTPTRKRSWTPCSAVKQVRRRSGICRLRRKRTGRSFPRPMPIERRQWKDALLCRPIRIPSAPAASPRLLGARRRSRPLARCCGGAAALRGFRRTGRSNAERSQAVVVDYLKEERKVLQAWSLYASGKTDEA